MSHTYATLAVSKACYKEIYDKLSCAGNSCAFHEDYQGRHVIDMHGIALFDESKKLTALPKIVARKEAQMMRPIRKKQPVAKINVKEFMKP